MAEVFPFIGYRFNEEKVENINQVVSPPYDKIDKEDHQKYLKKNPYNIVKLILGDNVDQKNNDYKNSAEYLNKWIDKDILKKDNSPVFYAYCQEYEVEGENRIRKGFIGLGKIEENEKIKAHEETMEGPKADRLNLLSSTETNFGHIFMLYSDKEKRIIKILNKIINEQSPLVSVEDRDGNLHQLWKIEDKELKNKIRSKMKNKNLYIADGHHRYQTALNFKKQCEKKGYSGDFDKRMMTFININDPGLTILATHRLLYDLDNFSPQSFLDNIKKDFIVTEFESKQEMYQKLENNQEKNHTFGFCAKKFDKYWTLTLKNENIMDKLINNKSKAWKKLDVSVLHKAILEKYFNIGEEELETKKNIEYVRYREKALEKLENGSYQAAFLLNPTKVEEVKEVADQGEKMPQKSTDFYPKLLTGLVLHKLTIKK